MKNRLILFFLNFLSFSCEAQKTELLDISFNEKKKTIFKDLKTINEPSEIVSTLPVTYTLAVEKFSFSDANLIISDKNDIVLTKVGILSKSNNEIVDGFVIQVENTETSKQILFNLKKRLKNSIVLSPEPKPKKNNILIGNSAIYWDMSDKVIILTQSYEYTDGKKTISSLIYVVKKNVTTILNDEPVYKRIIKTFKV